MSRTRSPSTNKPYGLARVAAAWGVSRSTYYARRHRRNNPVELRKRGPRTLLTDEELTERIRQEIAASPFTGEGHRMADADTLVQQGRMGAKFSRLTASKSDKPTRAIRPAHLTSRAFLQHSVQADEDDGRKGRKHARHPSDNSGRGFGWPASGPPRSGSCA